MKELSCLAGTPKLGEETTTLYHKGAACLKGPTQRWMQLTIPQRSRELESLKPIMGKVLLILPVKGLDKPTAWKHKEASYLLNPTLEWGNYQLFDIRELLQEM